MDHQHLFSAFKNKEALLKWREFTDILYQNTVVSSVSVTAQRNSLSFKMFIWITTDSLFNAWLLQTNYDQLLYRFVSDICLVLYTILLIQLPLGLFEIWISPAALRQHPLFQRHVSSNRLCVRVYVFEFFWQSYESSAWYFQKNYSNAAKTPWCIS